MYGTLEQTNEIFTRIERTALTRNNKVRLLFSKVINILFIKQLPLAQLQKLRHKIFTPSLRLAS